MANSTKPTIICPVCGYKAVKILFPPNTTYKCDNCGFLSCDENCVDISYKDDISSPLSNLYPHKFSLYGMYPNRSLSWEEITCTSMESFLQSLKIKDPTLQYYFMKNYIGMDAKKMSSVLDGWKKNQILYFAGKAYERESDEYTELITLAYDALYETNPVFSEIILPRFKGYNIIHSIGNDNKSETVLTEYEFRYQLNRLISKLDK